MIKSNKMPLSKLSFIYSVVTTLILVFSLMLVGLYEYKVYYEKKIKKLENSFISENRTLIKKEVSSVVHKLEKNIQERHVYINDIIEDRISVAINLLRINSKLKNPNNSYDFLDDIIYKKVHSYFVLFDNKGNVLYHQENKSNIGKNLFEMKNLDPELNKLIKDVMVKGKVSGNYKRKDYKTEKIRRLHVNIQKIDGMPIYIAVSTYADVIKDMLKESFLKQLACESFGYDGYGYFWVSDDQDRMVFHPIKKEMMNKSQRELQDINGVYIFKEIKDIVNKSGEGYFEYMWEVPGKDILFNKISFVQEIEEWGWRISAGFYLENFEKAIEAEKNALDELFMKLLFSALTVLAIILSIIFFVSYKISRKFQSIEKSQKKYMNLLSQYKMILDKSNIVSKTNLDGVITYVNPLFEQVCGYDKEFLVGKTHKVIKHFSTPRDTFKSLWETLLEGNTWEGLIKNRRKNRGEHYYCQTTIAPIKDENGKTQEYISVCTDVTEFIEQKDKIQNLFLTDNLTSLGSRMKLLEKISKAKDSNIAMIDIDRFRDVNDTFGNVIGDEILREVAKKLYALTNKIEVTSYRIYADVFVIYSEKLDNANFEKEIRNIVQILTSNTYGAKQDIHFSFTTGIASGDDDILVFADIALKCAKKGKLPFVIYNQDSLIVNEFKENFTWMKKLEMAIEKDKIVPYFQAIYNYKTEKIDKYEALMRYIENDGTVVSPFKFLEIAKKTKVYPELTKKIVYKTVKYFSEYPNIEFSINLTLEDLLNHNVMEYIYSLLQSHNMFKQVVFEIVESEELVLFEQVKNILSKFQEHGVKIAIDDFGSGYSNYAYLLELDVDFIKIDGSIIKKLHDSQSSRDLVLSIVDWATKSNIKTIAEFVWNEEIDKIIRDLHVDYAQGYLYGKPSSNIK